nr:hypothetical transcript [Hymenolepis microstoma]
MKESLTVPRPALVDDFLENLTSGAREDTERKAITFDTDHLNEVSQNIANNAKRMEREAYEWSKMEFTVKQQGEHFDRAKFNSPSFWEIQLF